RDRNGITDLLHDLRHRPNELVPRREPLEPGTLPGGDRTVRGRMKVAALLGLGELRTYCHGGLVPAEPAHHVGAPGLVLLPRLALEVLREVHAITALGNNRETVQGELRVVPPHVQFLGEKWSRGPLPV